MEKGGIESRSIGPKRLGRLGDIRKYERPSRTGTYAGVILPGLGGLTKISIRWGDYAHPGKVR